MMSSRNVRRKNSRQILKLKEAEVALVLAHKLMLQGWTVSSQRPFNKIGVEVDPLPNDHLSRRIRKRPRLYLYDLAIHDGWRGNKPLALIEVKRKNSNHNRMQQNAYRRCGIPHTYCVGLLDIPRVLAWTSAFLPEGGLSKDRLLQYAEEKAACIAARVRSVEPEKKPLRVMPTVPLPPQVAKLKRRHGAARVFARQTGPGWARYAPVDTP